MHHILKRIFFVDRHEGEKRLEELAANGFPKRWAMVLMLDKFILTGLWV